MSIASSTYPATGAERSGNFVLRLWFAAFFGLVFLRLGANRNILDKIIDYSTDGGSIVEKIHPSTYGIIAVLLAVLLTTRIELNNWELRALRSLLQFAAATFMLAALLLVLGHTGSLGQLVDSYLAACASGALLLFFPQSWRRSLAAALLIFIIAGAVVALGEFTLGARLLPYSLEEQSFRPTGLSEHPLMLGLLNAVGISFVAAAAWRPTAKAAAIVILLLGTFAAGARLASIVAGLSVLAAIALYDWPAARPQTRIRMKLLTFIAIALAVPAVLAVLYQFGLLERFENGLFDESAMARVKIYGLFNLVSWNEILFGADIEHIRRLALEHFDLQFIESSIVMLVFQFGLFGTILFILAMGRTVMVLLAGSSRYVVIGTIAFFAIAASNNSLTSKSPLIMMIVVLIIGFRGGEHPMRAFRSRRLDRARAG